MTMNSRILKVTLEMPNGKVVLNQTLFLRIRINKAALALQSKATIEVAGLSTQLRESMLSQFTAWNKRKNEGANLDNPAWINVKVEAGFRVNGKDYSSQVFIGQVVMVDLVAPPPDISIRITCYSRQIDKSNNVSSYPPGNVTFRAYVAWVAAQMNLGTNFICDTSYNDTVISNASRSSRIVGSLLIDLQSIYRPDVAAFVDDDYLIVKDRNKMINPNTIPKVSKFIGAPSWTEWGVSFVTMFDAAIRLGNGAELKSRINPSLNGQYVITELEYDLCSRERPFYVKGSGSPPA